MGFKIKDTNMKGLKLIIPHIFSDSRGLFLKDFEKVFFQENSLPTIFFESNESKSRKGVLRGLHFQFEYPQGKLIRVSNGSIFDVVVDLRRESSTYGKWQSFLLNSSNNHMLYIPEGFAHGFLTLEDDTIFIYKCTNKFASEFDGGIKFDDQDISIEWPFDLIGGINNLIISNKDSLLPSLTEIENKLKF